jgi:hypothetical protein
MLRHKESRFHVSFKGRGNRSKVTCPRSQARWSVTGIEPMMSGSRVRHLNHDTHYHSWWIFLKLPFLPLSWNSQNLDLHTFPKVLLGNENLTLICIITVLQPTSPGGSVSRYDCLIVQQKAYTCTSKWIIITYWATRYSYPVDSQNISYSCCNGGSSGLLSLSMPYSSSQL